ncbi:beta-class carbonic anhydrase [Methanobrevibacter boviskoreani]|uniref:beta-class carbonic anhydrase n=1 Tax=Methanobrevibacter boviskoreani TaxID=1348249 RepID=UPI0005935D19|nr:carbonic anhydrase [Methanobrevibacter boviskoreani]
MMIDEVLKANEEFTKNFEGEELGHLPKKKLAILTCMDTRLVNFLEPALGIERGDAKIIKNAGNTIVGEDAVRSIAAAIYSLGAEEVMVIGHTNCGMAHADEEKIINKMLEMGISKEEIDKVDIKEWIGAIDGEESNVIKTVDIIKNHPLITDEVPIHGLIIDIVSGELKVLVDGRE